MKVKDKKRPRVIDKNEKNFADQYFQPIFTSILALAGLMYALLNSEYRTGIYNDDALYVLTSRDFWNTLTLHPLLGVKADYPLPGLPLLLYPITHLVAPHYVEVEWVSVVAALFSVFLLGKWIRPWLSSEQTLLVVALYAFHPLVARFSGIVMPASYFALAAIASFYLMEETFHRPSVKKDLLLGLITGWASLIHPDGALILVSVAGALLFSHTGRKTVLRMLIPLAAWGMLAVAWFHHRVTERTEYGGDITALWSYWSHNIWPAFKFPYVWFEHSVFTTWGFLHTLQTSQQKTLSIFLFSLFVFGVGWGVYRMWKNTRSNRYVFAGVISFCVLFIGVHIFWHIPDARYSIPIMPFLTIFIVCAIPRPWWSRMVFGLILYASCNENVHTLYKALFAHDPLDRPPWYSLNWIQSGTAPDTKIISNIAPSVDLFTGRHASPLLNVTSVDMLQYVLLNRDFKYLFLRNGSGTASTVDGTENVNVVWNRYRRWAENYPNRFPVAFISPTGTAKVYRVASNPTFVAAYKKFIIACDHAQKKEYQQAYVETRNALAIDPKLGCAQNLLGALYFLANDYKAAESAFLKAAELLPDSPNPQLNLASLYHVQNLNVLSLESLMKGKDINNANGVEPEVAEKIRTLPERWDRKDHQLLIDFYLPD